MILPLGFLGSGSVRKMTSSGILYLERRFVAKAMMSLSRVSEGGSVVTAMRRTRSPSTGQGLAMTAHSRMAG